MRIQSVTFRDFRSYERFSLADIGDLTILVGRNAAGKTNVLEGLQLLTSASSFRRPLISQLVREGAAHASLSIELSDGNRALTTELQLEPGKKRYLVNGKAKSAADVRGILPSVMFTPDDLQLAKKSSSVKRDAIDELGSQLNRSYYIVRRDYEKTIRYKNRLLKDDADPLLVESINESLITCGAQLYCLRRSLFERMLPAVTSNYAALSQGGEIFHTRYVPSWDKLAGAQEPAERVGVGAFRRESAESASTAASQGAAEGDGSAASHHAPTRFHPPEIREKLAEELARYAREERARHRSLVGPHNDQILFALDGHDASSFASQGQQRSIVLAWKMSEVTVTQEILGVNPVLLLDDVLSELDSERRRMLVGFVTEDVQTFVTTTDLSGFDGGLVDRARIVELT